MMISPGLSGLLCVAVWLILRPSSIAQSTGRDEKIALSGETAPSGGTYSSFAPPVLNGANQVAFAAATVGGPSSGIYLGTVDSVASIAVQGAPAPGGNSFETLDQFPVLNEAGQVAFLSTTFDGPAEGIYLGTPGTLSAVALTGRAAPRGAPSPISSIPRSTVSGRFPFSRMLMAGRVLECTSRPGEMSAPLRCRETLRRAVARLSAFRSRDSPAEEEPRGFRTRAEVRGRAFTSVSPMASVRLH